MIESKVHRYLRTWSHADAILFLQSVITPAPTEGNIEDQDHDIPSIYAADGIQ
jgi:hypothetical protein